MVASYSGYYRLPLGLESSVRPSLAFYNTREEVDALVLALRSLKRS